MKKKILTLLVLLCLTVSGAWAQEETLLTTIENSGDNASFISGSKTFDNIATVTFSGTVYNEGGEGGWCSFQGITLTVTAAEGYTITRVKFYNASGSAFDEETPFEAILLLDDDLEDITKVNGTSIGTGGVTKIEVYGYSDTPAATDYYLVGNMTSWGIDPQYKLALNESAGDANEYQIAVALPAATELKVVSSTDGTTIKGWFPAEAGNYTVTADGLYTIYFRPNGNGGDDWHANCIYVADGVSFTADGEAWTLAQMPACDVELEVEYFPLATLATTPAAAEGLNDATTADLLTPGTSTEGTLYYALGTSEAPTGQWSTDIPTTEGLEAGEYYVWYKVVGDAEHSDSQPQSIAVTIAEAPAYAVTIDDAGVDASNWQAAPAEQKAGQTVTLSYGGKKKVKSITIEAAPAATDLSTINANYTANDGETLTGTLGSNVKISIADGATVTLNNVNIIGTNDDDYGWAGITCVGDATIILNGTNTVKGFYEDHPGIYVPVDHTVTIKGSGSLTASSNGYGCGIGGGYNIACGNIEIQGGTVMATGVADAAGIGSGYSGSCGTITISGGTVTATGGTDGAGIGSADENASCGAITIEGGNVMATGGVYAAGIGSGGSGGASCGTITISGGNVTAIAGTAAAAIGKSSDGTCTSVTINSDITSLTLKNSQGTGIVSDFINATAVNAGENDITYMLPTSVTDPTITGGMTSAGFATSYNSGTKTWTITKN